MTAILDAITGYHATGDAWNAAPDDADTTAFERQTDEALDIITKVPCASVQDAEAKLRFILEQREHGILAAEYDMLQDIVECLRRLPGPQGAAIDILGSLLSDYEALDEQGIEGALKKALACFADERPSVSVHWFHGHEPTTFNETIDEIERRLTFAGTVTATVSDQLAETCGADADPQIEMIEHALRPNLDAIQALVHSLWASVKDKEAPGTVAV